MRGPGSRIRQPLYDRAKLMSPNTARSGAAYPSSG
jgi:hypothetical protein